MAMSRSETGSVVAAVGRCRLVRCSRRSVPLVIEICSSCRMMSAPRSWPGRSSRSLPRCRATRACKERSVGKSADRSTMMTTGEDRAAGGSCWSWIFSFPQTTSFAPTCPVGDAIAYPILGTRDRSTPYRIGSAKSSRHRMRRTTESPSALCMISTAFGTTGSSIRTNERSRPFDSKARDGSKSAAMTTLPSLASSLSRPLSSRSVDCFRLVRASARRHLARELAASVALLRATRLEPENISVPVPKEQARGCPKNVAAPSCAVSERATRPLSTNTCSPHFRKRVFHRETLPAAATTS
jgi:hypothetical protein